MTVNVKKCCITCALRSKGNALSPANRSSLTARFQTTTYPSAALPHSSPPSAPRTPAASYRVTDSGCSQHLILGFMRCPSAYRHHIRRETLKSITQTLHTRCTSGIRTQLGRIKAHSHSLGKDYADSLANQVVDGHPPVTAYDTGSDVSIGACVGTSIPLPSAYVQGSYLSS
jgi:hypothetical protein